MMGKRPYNGKSRKELKEQIIAKEVKQKQLPDKWTDPNVIDFVNRLLTRKPEERLGSKGIEEVMNHPWLNDINWKHKEAMTQSSPFSFDSQDNFDEYYANKKEDEHTNRKNTVLKKIPINTIAKAKNNSINKEINSTRDVSLFQPMMRETKDKDLSSIEPISMKISRRNSKVINKS